MASHDDLSHRRHSFGVFQSSVWDYLGCDKRRHPRRICYLMLLDFVRGDSSGISGDKESIDTWFNSKDCWSQS